MTVAVCLIGDGTNEWEEKLSVSSVDTAEQDVNKILSKFNEEEQERYHGDASCRKLVKIIEVSDDNLVGREERYADCFNAKLNRLPKRYMPKVMVEEGEFPFRCPICWKKYMQKSDAQLCVEACWQRIEYKIKRKLGT